VRALALIGCIACGGSTRPAPPHVPPLGVSIALYASGDKSYGFVDDRREVDVVDQELVLELIDPRAPLHALVVEGLGVPIRTTACTRARIREAQDREAAGQLSPLVRCRVDVAAGRYRVRVVHVTSLLAFQARHELTMTAVDKAQLATRFSIATPLWRVPADLTLFEGVPGEDRPPRELARGRVTLDGSTAVLSTGAPRIVPARLRAIYDGSSIDPDDDATSSDIAWARASRHQVWMWLELRDPQIARGALRAHVEVPGTPTRDLELGPELRRDVAGAVRWRAWIDEDLVGTRKRTVHRADAASITDGLELAISNLGNVPREVWIEEPLRMAKRRQIARAWPARPVLGKHFARSKLVVGAGKTERIELTIDYEL